MAATEQRIAATKNMLASMKAIKMMGAGQRMGAVIEKLRILEFAASKNFRTLLLCSIVTCELFPYRYTFDFLTSYSVRHTHSSAGCCLRSLCWRYCGFRDDKP